MSSLKPQAPKNATVILSLVLVLLGLFGSKIIPGIAGVEDYFVLGAYVLLLLAVYIKGL